jgi:hypothetical protein
LRDLSSINIFYELDERNNGVYQIKPDTSPVRSRAMYRACSAPQAHPGAMMKFSRQDRESPCVRSRAMYRASLGLPGAPASAIHRAATHRYDYRIILLNLIIALLRDEKERAPLSLI